MIPLTPEQYDRLHAPFRDSPETKQAMRRFFDRPMPRPGLKPALAIEDDGFPGATDRHSPLAPLNEGGGEAGGSVVSPSQPSPNGDGVSYPPLPGEGQGGGTCNNGGCSL